MKLITITHYQFHVTLITCSG